MALDGWIDGWVGGWMDGRAYSNSQKIYIQKGLHKIEAHIHSNLACAPFVQKVWHWIGGWVGG